MKYNSESRIEPLMYDMITESFEIIGRLQITEYMILGHWISYGKKDLVES